MKTLDRLYIRVDAKFPDDERYVSLPRGLRDSAYLFFLALNGWSRDKRTDGRIPDGVAETVARHMGHSAPRARALVGALARSGLLDVDDSGLFIPKYAKWQDTAEEIGKHSEVRRLAGRAGGLASGRSKREANASKQASNDAEAKPKQNEAETETETETESLSPEVPSERQNPPARARMREGATDGLTTEDPDVQAYVERWVRHAGQPSALDLAFFRRVPYECDRLSRQAVLEEIERLADRFLGKSKPMPAASYLGGRLADLQAAASDSGVRPRARSGLTRLGEVLGNA